MARPRSKAQRERDRVLVADLYKKGYEQNDIAKVVGICQATVSNDIKALIEDWRKSSLIDINDAQQVELMRINKLEVEYWEAWEESKKEFKSSSVKKKGAIPVQNKDGENITVSPIETTLRNENRCGDPRYLQGIQWCINKRCEILGLDTVKVYPVGSDENKSFRTDVARVEVYIPDNRRTKNE